MKRCGPRTSKASAIEEPTIHLEESVMSRCQAEAQSSPQRQPLVIVLVPLGTVLNKNIRQQEEEKLSETSRQLGRFVDEVTDRTARELVSLQSNPFLSDAGADLGSKLKEMQRLVRIYEVYSDISLYDNDGFLLGSTSEEHPSFRDYSDWFRKALNGDIVL